VADHAWRIPYREARQRYQQDQNLSELIAGVAQIYAMAPDVPKAVA
jgi:hypothetical protein